MHHPETEILTTKILQAADTVVAEIKKAGGKAVANYDSVENGERIIATAMDNFGRVDVLINNAGILRDTAFKNLTPQNFDLVIKVHVDGAFKVGFGQCLRYSGDTGILILCNGDVYSARELRGQSLESKSLVGLSTRRRPLVCLEILDRPTILVWQYVSVTSRPSISLF